MNDNPLGAGREEIKMSEQDMIPEPEDHNLYEGDNMDFIDCFMKCTVISSRVVRRRNN